MASAFQYELLIFSSSSLIGRRHVGSPTMYSKSRSLSFPICEICRSYTRDDEDTGDNLGEAGDEVGDVDIGANVLSVEGEAVVDHGHYQPGEVDIQRPPPHLRGLLMGQ